MAGETTELARLIDEKWEIVNDVFNIARRQEAVIAEQRLSELMPVLTQKQAALDRLAEIQQALQPFADQDPDQRVWPNGEARERCRDREQQCNQLLQQIMQLDAQCERELTESRNKIAERLQQTTGSEQAAKAYRASQAPDRSRGGRLDLTAG